MGRVVWILVLFVILLLLIGILKLVCISIFLLDKLDFDKFVIVFFVIELIF